MSDLSGLIMSEPPKIDADLTESQLAEFRRVCFDVEAACDRVEDRLISVGLSPVHAVSASAHAMMNALARQAIVTAMLDGREANREWFLHNCATAFDRWHKANADI